MRGYAIVPTVLAILLSASAAPGVVVEAARGGVGSAALAGGLEPPVFARLPGLAPHAPLDPYAASQYSFAQVRLEPGLAVTPESDVVLCILDSGIRDTHEEIRGGRLLATRDFIEDRTKAAGQHYHGTFVSSIAAGNSGNGVGIQGAAEVPFVHGRILNETGWGYFREMAAAVRWCAGLPYRHVVLTTSVGGWPDSTDMHEWRDLHAAVQEARAAGLVLVASAMNENSNRPPCFDCVGYPAAFEEVIAVTSTSPGEVPSWWSSWGPEADIAAPGDIILGASNGADDEYTAFSGTSFSAPLVAGVLALAWSREPDLTSDELIARLYATSQDVATPGWDIYTGHGELDAACLFANRAPCDGRS